MSQDPARDQSIIQSLGRAINAILKGDWRQRTEEAGEEVERLLGTDPPLHQESWHRMKGWYRAAVDRTLPPLPDRVTLERIRSEQVYLYRHVPPLGGNIPVFIEPFLVEDSVLTEDKI